MSGRSVRNGSGGSCCGESFCAKTTATTVNQLLWQAVRRFGERPALAWEQQGKSCRMTYSELGEEVLRLAKQLQRQGVTRNSRVAILAERRAELILAEAAVICAGGAFCCLDPEAPPQRNQLILADLQPSVFLCQQHLLNKLSPGAAQWKTVVLPLETFCCKQTSSQRTEVTIHNNNNNNVDKELLEEEKEEDIQVNNRPEDLAYLVYTSGTTGKPKGVMVTHQNLVNFVESSMRRTCHHRKQLHRTTSIARRTEEEADKHEGEQEEHHWYYEEGDRTLPTAAVQFDIHVMEVWCALSAGASLFLIAKWEVLDSSFLAQYLGKHNVNKMFMATGLFHRYANTRPDILGQLEALCVGGDSLSASLAMAVANSYPGLRLLNAYGPSETTLWASYFRVRPGRHYERIPIGFPLHNYVIYVLDE